MRRFFAIALSSTLLLQAMPLMAGPPMRAPGAGRAQPPAATGTINGTARSSTGEPLPNYTVHLRNLQTGEIAGTTTTNAAGGFSFAGLSPANYIIEIVNQAGAIVGSSAAIPVAAGATVTITVSETAAIAGGAAAGAAGAGATGGISRAVIVTTVAVAAGVVGVVVVKARNDASPSR